MENYYCNECGSCLAQMFQSAYTTQKIQKLKQSILDWLKRKGACVVQLNFHEIIEKLEDNVILEMINHVSSSLISSECDRLKKSFTELDIWNIILETQFEALAELATLNDDIYSVFPDGWLSDDGNVANPLLNAKIVLSFLCNLFEIRVIEEEEKKEPSQPSKLLVAAESTNPFVKQEQNESFSTSSNAFSAHCCQVFGNFLAEKVILAQDDNIQNILKQIVIATTNHSTTMFVKSKSQKVADWFDPLNHNDQECLQLADFLYQTILQRHKGEENEKEKVEGRDKHVSLWNKLLHCEFCTVAEIAFLDEDAYSLFPDDWLTDFGDVNNFYLDAKIILSCFHNLLLLLEMEEKKDENQNEDQSKDNNANPLLSASSHTNNNNNNNNNNLSTQQGEHYLINILEAIKNHNTLPTTFALYPKKQEYTVTTTQKKKKKNKVVNDVKVKLLSCNYDLLSSLSDIDCIITSMNNHELLQRLDQKEIENELKYSPKLKKSFGTLQLTSSGDSGVISCDYIFHLHLVVDDGDNEVVDVVNVIRMKLIFVLLHILCVI